MAETHEFWPILAITEEPLGGGLESMKVSALFLWYSCTISFLG